MEFRQAILGTETGIAVLEAALGSEDLLLHGILLEGPRRKDLVAGESRQPVRHKQEGGHIEMVAFHEGQPPDFYGDVRRERPHSSTCCASSLKRDACIACTAASRAGKSVERGRHVANSQVCRLARTTRRSSRKEELRKW